MRDGLRHQRKCSMDMGQPAPVSALRLIPARELMPVFLVQRRALLDYSTTNGASAAQAFTCLEDYFGPRHCNDRVSGHNLFSLGIQKPRVRCTVTEPLHLETASPADAGRPCLVWRIHLAASNVQLSSCGTSSNTCLHYINDVVESHDYAQV